mgnify:CR=1 FL=1
MKIKEGFVLRSVAGNWVVLPMGDSTVKLSGMLTLNDSGKLLWDILQQGADRNALVRGLLAEYEISPETAAADVDRFLESLSKTGCLEQ